MARIGIRREDKSRWEARVPLVPADVGRFIRERGLEFTVESSPIRAFPDAEYEAVGAKVADDLSDCPIILGVKEIPVPKLQAEKTYVYFSHTIKGQRANMPALKRLLELNCQLVDYEKIVDANGRRLVFFGNYAGMAGMVDTLWAFGQRLQHEGIANPFSRITPAHQYENLAHVKREMARIGEAIRRNGLPEAIQPFVCGFAGYGQVSHGAQEVFDLLPFEEVRPEELAALHPSRTTCYKVVFHEEHTVERADGSGAFRLQEYYSRPELYKACFFTHLPHLTVLVNCIYWEAKYPRLVTIEQLKQMFDGQRQPRLRVIGDISCDVNGSIECTVRTTDPGSPVYVFEPASGQTKNGVAGAGPVILAIDFLPCELPVDSSRFFSRSLGPFIAPLGRADFSRAIEQSGLPTELQRATIVYHGRLTEPFRYLERHLG